LATGRPPGGTQSLRHPPLPIQSRLL